ncbi:MAG: EamA family transporter [Patescibacteria group bacterium]
MPSYFLGVAIAFLEPVLHGWCNILDSYFANKLFPRLTTLIFFGSVVGVVLLPVVYFIDPPQWVPTWAFGLIFLIALIEVGYSYPYYWALKHTDTSIVTSLFSIGRIFVPILAFFIVDERLTYIQYAGFGLIVLAATLLNFDPKKFRFNPALFLMVGVCCILAIETITYKYVFEHGVTWGSLVVVEALFEFAIAAVLMVITGALSSLRRDLAMVRGHWRLLGLNYVLGWGGNLGDSFAVSLLPVSVARGIGSTQALFVLGYALLTRKHFPKIFKEHLSGNDVRKKSALFVSMVVGTLLVVLGGVG